ncbi:MAG: CTP synthase [candidate division WWE3 bacterium]|nr:CTP synthase [candidate division WWE3 bacterium]
MRTKFLFVTGGVISGLGKGITTASIGLLLKSAGYKVSVLKVDMYLNVDAGTMNPLEHGEVFVTEDGLETDQDLGHYERFLGQNLGRRNYLTMGQVYWEVLNKERRLEYGGKCVEGHIHIPEHIISHIKETARLDKADIMLIEVGGTVGEYQNILFFEAIRRFKQANPKDVFLAHLVFLMVPEFLGEMKTKPAQASIYDLYALGLQPNFVICRSAVPADAKRRRNIAFNTGVKEENIVAAPDVNTIYKIPLILKEQGLDVKLQQEMGLKVRVTKTHEWEKFVERALDGKKEIRIAVAGKYFTSGNFCLEDSYVCVIEAIKHAAWAHDLRPVIKWFDVEKMESDAAGKLSAELLTYDGIIVPQGWGSRGVEGKLKVVELARQNKIPYLGLCFGMQMAVIEYARNVLGFKDANSEEVDPKTTHPVIHLMNTQKENLDAKKYGGTIRLGAWPCKLQPGTLLEAAYQKYGDPKTVTVQERHRHRYEFNNAYKKELLAAGLVIGGLSPDGKLVEAIELPRDKHPFFVATQYHPEYKSRPLTPHPLFLAFIKACAK